MTTYTITFTEHRYTTIVSGLSEDQLTRQRKVLEKQNIIYCDEPFKRITGNLK